MEHTNPIATYIDGSADRRAEPALPGPARIAEKTWQPPQGCSGGPLRAGISSIQHGLRPPEPVLRGQPLLLPSAYVITRPKTEAAHHPQRGRATAASSLEIQAKISIVPPKTHTNPRRREHQLRFLRVSSRTPRQCHHLGPFDLPWHQRHSRSTYKVRPIFHSYFVYLTNYFLPSTITPKKEHSCSLFFFVHPI